MKSAAKVEKATQLQISGVSISGFVHATLLKRTCVFFPKATKKPRYVYK